MRRLSKRKILSVFLSAVMIMTLCISTVSAEPLTSSDYTLSKYSKAVSRSGYIFARKEGNKKNTVYSPYGLAAAIGMLSLGVDEGSRSYKEIMDLFGAETAQQIGAANKAFMEQAYYGPENTFASENFLLVDKTMAGKDGLKSEFSSLATQYYSAQARTADFKNNLGAEKAQIKSDVNRITNGFMPDYESVADEETDVDLMNVTYFKGRWMYPFDKQNTEKQSFTNVKGKTKKVDMMQQRLFEKVKYYQDKNFRAISLPYNLNYSGGKAPTSSTMVIILPKNKKDTECVKKWNKKKASYKDKFIKKLEKADTFNIINLKLPSFELDVSNDLSDEIEAMGVKGIFSQNSGITKVTDAPLYISAASQRTKIKVDEEGTEAAAVTELVAKATAMRPEKLPKEYNFYCNVPFVFMVRDASGMTLFAGAVNKL